MTIREATERWIKEFSEIPLSLLEIAYSRHLIDIYLRSDKPPQENHIAAHGIIYLPKLKEDKDWLYYHPQAIASCGFLLYYCEECGLFLAIDGYNYDFMVKHWIPLYLVRDLQWHDKN